MIVQRFSILTMFAALAVTACGVGAESVSTREFEPGDSADPILQRVAALSSQQNDSLSVTITNSSNAGWTQGLITLSAPFVVGAKPSNPMLQFVSQSSSKQGNATVFAQSLGLTVGVDAFVVPALAKGASTTVALTVPATAKLSFIARVVGSLDDFAAVVDAPLTSGAPGAASSAMVGYDLQNSAGVVSVGNGTIGQSAGNSSFVVVDQSDCASGKLTVDTRLIFDDFSKGAGDSIWPAGYGWDADFNGDWYTDGITARVYNPNWGGADPKATLPAVTGFFKTLSICPVSSALLQIDSKVVTQYSDPTSDTTLVVYFFNRGGQVLNIAANSPLHDRSDRHFSIFDLAIPAATRQIVVAPMARIGAAEQGSVYYDWVSVDYELSSSWAVKSVATDDFSKSSNGQYGTNQPTGWSEFGGDWYAMTAQKWATLGNPVWSGGTAGVDTGLVKTFALTGRAANESINAQIFAASTFTDPSSFVRVRLIFNDAAATVIESDRQVRGWGTAGIRRAAIPATATQATAVINVYLGSTETSSLYVDNFSLSLTHKN